MALKRSKRIMDARRAMEAEKRKAKQAAEKAMEKRKADLEKHLREGWERYEIGNVIAEIRRELYGVRDARQVASPRFWGSGTGGTLRYESPSITYAGGDCAEHYTRVTCSLTEESGRYKLNLRLMKFGRYNPYVRGRFSFTWLPGYSKELLFKEIDRQLAGMLNKEQERRTARRRKPDR